MQQNELTLLLGEAYYREALLCAQSNEWDGCREHLRGMSSLLPLDHRAAVLHAQVLLREGHLEASLAALQAAKDLGHDGIENDRMAAFILGWDEKQYARLKRRVARRRFVRGCKRKTIDLTMKIVTFVGDMMGFVADGISGLFTSKNDQDKEPDTTTEESACNVRDESDAEKSKPSVGMTGKGSCNIESESPKN